jgi:hypothetical protein
MLLLFTLLTFDSGLIPAGTGLLPTNLPLMLAACPINVRLGVAILGTFERRFMVGAALEEREEEFERDILGREEGLELACSLERDVGILVEKLFCEFGTGLRILFGGGALVAAVGKGGA